MSLTPEQRRADRAIISAATPGPWALHEWTPRGGKLRRGIGNAQGLAHILLSRSLSAHDAAFIARAREGWPAALDALDAADKRAVALGEVREFLSEALARQTAKVARLRALFKRVPHLTTRSAGGVRIVDPLTEGAHAVSRAECARLGGACAMEEEAPR